MFISDKKFDIKDIGPENTVVWKGMSTEDQRQMVLRMCQCQTDPALIEHWLQVAFTHPVRGQKAKELLPPVINRFFQEALNSYSTPTQSFWSFLQKMLDTNIKISDKLFDNALLKKALDKNAQGRKWVMDVLDHEKSPARFHTTVCSFYLDAPNNQNQSIMDHVDLQKIITKDSRHMCLMINNVLKHSSKPTQQAIYKTINNAYGLKLAQRMINTFSTECFQSYKGFLHQAIEWWPHDLVCDARKPYLLQLFEQQEKNCSFNDRINQKKINNITQYLKTHQTNHAIAQAVNLKKLDDTPKKRSKM